jgi:uncharacterized membrane protein affecting hemolysin expression
MLMIWTHAYNTNRRLVIIIFAIASLSIWSLLSSIWRMTLVFPLSNETQNSAQNSKYSQVRVAQQAANLSDKKTISMIVAEITIDLLVRSDRELAGSNQPYATKRTLDMN